MLIDTVQTLICYVTLSSLPFSETAKIVSLVPQWCFVLYRDKEEILKELLCETISQIFIICHAALSS